MSRCSAIRRSRGGHPDAGSARRLAHLPRVGRPAASASARCARSTASSLSVRPGEVVALVGEFGLRQDHAGAHAARAAGADRRARSASAARPAHALPRREIAALVQPVFQDPYSSLNPRKSIGSIIALPLRVQGDRDSPRPGARRVEEMMERVGLARGLYDNYPEPALRRPAPARRHRARAHQPAAPGDLRRADLGARRLRAVADPEPAAGPAPRPGPHLPADQPQPRRGRAHGDARRRHVSRAHRRGGRDRHAVPRAASIPTARRCSPPC